MIPAGSRRSKIRPPRKSLGGQNSKTDDSLSYESAWSVLSNAIVQIQNKNVSNLSYEQLYRKAYTLVLRKYGGRLYDDVSRLIGEHLEARRRAILKVYDDALTSNDEEFLQLTMREWAEHLQSMKFISDVLMYLNRVYVKENKRLLIYDLGIVLFDLHFVRYNNSDIGNKLITIILNEIGKSRKGQVITTKSYISQVISMFETLSQEHIGLANSLPQELSGSDDMLYSSLFEPAFLHNSEVFFSNLADEFLAYGQGSKYLQDVYQFVQEEEDRLNQFVSDSTHSKLVSLMNNILIKDKIDRVMCYPIDQQGLSYWLEPIMIQTTNSSEQFGTTNVRNHTAELHILYELVGRVDPDRKLLKLRLRDVIVSQGTELPNIIHTILEQHASVSVPNGSKKSSSSSSSSSFAIRWVDTVLNYQRHLLQLVKDAFSGDVSIEHTIFSAMRDFVNASNQPQKKASNAAPLTNAPELLSVFMDSSIKQLSKANSSKRLATDANASVDETEEFLHNAIAFLKFIKDKDAFEAHYAAHFAKRFLNSKISVSASSGGGYGGDLEELAISKLSEELGSASLEKITRMKKDVNQSAELTREWKNYTSALESDLVELELKICHVSDWPNSMTKDYKSFASVNGTVGFIWPSQFRETMKTFEEFWQTGKKNDNKTLFWCPKFGSMDLRITYPSKTYEINLSTYAGVIMMLFAPQSTNGDGNPVSAFDEKRELTYEEIFELTNIPEADLKRQLQSIAVAPRSRLLVKIPMSKDVNPTDKFRLNDKFKAPGNKVKVLTVSSSSSAKPESGKKSIKQEESDEVKTNIEERRKHLVNAAIVRIMKSRQTINHNDLIAELIKQLQNQFQPSTLLIKQRIEDLIEKEYLERDNDTPSIYHYVA